MVNDSIPSNVSFSHWFVSHLLFTKLKEEPSNLLGDKSRKMIWKSHDVSFNIRARRYLNNSGAFFKQCEKFFWYSM